MTTKHLFRALPPREIAQLSKSIGMCFVVLFSISALKSQTAIYTQPFSGTLAASGWVNTNLTAPWGNASFFGFSNVWRVADGESGLSANSCGAGGMGDQSLHMVCAGLVTGAAYLSDINTNRRISSPNISTTGYTNIILDFDYIGNGEAATDKAYFVYSIDGGTTWVNATGAPTSVNPAMGAGGSMNDLKSQICVSGQGRWTHLTWNMPVTCEGITNLRAGFVWQSNNNSLGSDPSFAVDDVVVSGTLTPAPIELILFKGQVLEKKNKLEWITATETNNDYFSIERSSDASDFNTLLNVDGAGNSIQMIHYAAFDDDPVNGISYYRLKQTDYDGNFSYSNIASLYREATTFDILNTYNSEVEQQLEITITCTDDCLIFSELYSTAGKKVFSSKLNSSNSKIVIPTSNLSKGVYLIKISDGNKIITRKVML